MSDSAKERYHTRVEEDFDQGEKLSPLPTTNNNPVVAIATADWHIHHAPPRFRAEQGDSWYKAMARPLKQIRKLQSKYDCPIIHSGDLFDNANQPPELLNWLVNVMPCVVGVPGQHDLFHHRLADLKRSAWWSMVEMGRVKYIEPGYPLKLGEVILWGFPWGEKIIPCEENTHTFGLQVAVCHRYMWIEGKGYKDAPEDERLRKTLPNLKGYETTLFGDNHTTVEWNLNRFKSDKPSVFNPGSMMVRNSDQVRHQPCVGLVRRDGTISKHYLDISKDKYSDKQEKEIAQEMDLSEFVSKAEDLSKGESVDFTEACKRLMKTKKLHPGVERFITMALENRKC